MFRRNLNPAQIFAVVMSVVLLSTIFIMYGCGKEKPEVIKIGVIYPLTGDASFWGQNARNGAMLAIEDFNSSGGVNGKKVEAIIEDSKSTPKNAVSAANKLIFQDKVKFIVGDLASSNFLAIAPICEQNQVVTIGQGSSPKIREAGDYIFRTFPSDDLQGRAVAQFVNETLSPQKVSILFVNNEYGLGVVEVVKKFLSASVAIEEGYESATKDFRSILQKVPKSGDGVLIVVAYPEELAALLKQIAEVGLNIPVVGTETFENENIKNIQVPYPIYYTVPRFADEDSQVYKQFVAGYKEKFGKNPGVPADAAYDAAMLILKGIKEVGYNSQKVKDYLYSVKNYQGVSGMITFDEYGDVMKPFRIKQLKDGTESIVSEVRF